MFNLTETERAYLAGLFDGEGTLGFYHYRRNRHEVTVGIVNTDPRVHAWLREKFGCGSVRPSTKNRNNHVAYSWRIAGRTRIEPFLNAILPYLIIKKEQAQCLLDLWSKELTPKMRITDDVFAQRSQVEAELKHLKRAFLEEVDPDREYKWL